jgi:acyl carrier protein
MDIKEKIKQIILDFCELPCLTDQIDDDADLTEIGLNSYSYIKLIVTLEDEFNIQISNEDLDYNMFNSINKISNNIEKYMKNDKT